ncbi:hypothetical protein [Staphylococcus carnosus]|uniref:hypothetical protein n=1 Tax=Staphylococcus carnosus TaxID=1281 RepID=UPI00081AA997|nr:hypothetical protein [Staphylococcus carnosus]ANZ33060.1 hypothetical protein BEK99_04245 [Staphylococcus carnosus]UTB85198.1 hypothetical protein A2I66_05850 [Staphylococcus carnosus]
MNIKLRSQSGKNYYATFATDDFKDTVKMILDCGLIYIKVTDKKGRKGLLKITEIESFIEEDDQ